MVQFNASVTTNSNINKSMLPDIHLTAHILASNGTGGGGMLH